MLKDLEIDGWVAQDPVSRRWRPGPALDALIRSRPYTDLVQQAEPVLEHLCHKSGHTVLLIVAEGRHLRCAAKAVHEDGQSMQAVGALRTSFADYPWGWILWASLDPQDQDAVLATEADPAGARVACQAGLAAVARDGWCRQEQAGLVKLAAPVRDASGRAVACLGCGIAGRDADEHQPAGRLLAATADALATDVFGPHDQGRQPTSQQVGP